MKKATLTNNQIETLKYNLEIAIKYHDDNETITAKLKEIDSFLGYFSFSVFSWKLDNKRTYV